MARFMPYSCTVLCGVLPCVNFLYSVEMFIKGHMTSPASWLLSTLRPRRSAPHAHSPVHFFKTVCGKEEALDFGMTGFEGTAVRQGEEDWLVFCCKHCVGESKCAWLLISVTREGHSQFPSALYGSVYSELWEADEALSLLILQADGGWWWWQRHIINTENKMLNM